MDALVEVEAASAGARAVGLAATAPPARCIGAGVVGAVVSGRHFVVVIDVLSSSVAW